MGEFDWPKVGEFEVAIGAPAAVRNMIHEGKWLEGRQYFRRCGRVYVSVKGYEKWVATGLA